MNFTPNEPLAENDTSLRNFGLCFILLSMLFSGWFVMGHLDLHNEEGRRVISAKEMIESGNYIVPTVWGEPYLNKPPLYAWLTVAASWFTGEVDQFSVRWPAFLSTLLISLLLVIVGAKLGDKSSGLLAACFFWLSPEIAAKSILGETDVLLTLGVALFSLPLIFLTRRGERIPIAIFIAATLGLIIAWLAKGASAIPFVFGTLIALGLRDGFHWKRIGSFLVPVLISVAVASVWFIEVQQRTVEVEATEIWRQQVFREGSGFFNFGKMMEYVVGVFLAFLPGSLLIINRDALRASGKSLGLTWTAILSVIMVPAAIFLFWPGTQPRYLLPLMPLICLLVARVILDAGRLNGLEGLNLILRVVFVIGPAAIAVSSVMGWNDFGLNPVPPLFWVISALLLAVSITKSEKLEFTGIPFLSRTLLLFFSINLGMFYVAIPKKAIEGHEAQVAEKIYALVEEDETIWIEIPGNWNALALLDRSVKRCTESAEWKPGDWRLGYSEKVSPVVGGYYIELPEVDRALEMKQIQR